jgi:hypothetical protein
MRTLLDIWKRASPHEKLTIITLFLVAVLYGVAIGLYMNYLIE